MIAIGVAIAGALGAVSRAWIDAAIERRSDETLPVATLFINTSGSFVLGLLAGLALYHGLANNTKTVLGTGFCGGYTTFSTFAFQTVRLGEQRAWRGALGNVGFSIVLPVAFAAAGLALAAL